MSSLCGGITVGAVSFSIDPQLTQFLVRTLPLTHFIETGTFLGDSLMAVRPLFKTLISVEISESLYQQAQQRFTTIENLHLHLGNSPDVLAALRSSLQDVGGLFFLDAHWCVAEGTAGEKSQCPLLDELQALGSLNKNSVVIIDDARLFLAPPTRPHLITHWPSFDEVLKELRQLSSHHRVMIFNDVIIFYPETAAIPLREYAFHYGIDWLMATRALNENTELRQLLDQRTRDCEQLTESALLKQLTLLKQELAKSEAAVRAYRQAFGSFSPLRLFARALRRAREIFRPRLGWMYQYNPRILKPAIPQFKIPKFELPKFKVPRPLLGNLIQHAPRPLVSLPSKKLSPSFLQAPKISIVTPSYMQGTFIEKTMQSILSQEYPNLQYYVQDGGSTDCTLDVLRKYSSQLSGWSSKRDTGQAQAINWGFDQTDGEIMAWLNSDDLLTPGSLRKVAKFFMAHPTVDVVYGNRLMIDEEGHEIGRWILPGHDGEVLSWADYIPQETLFWRRSIWDKIGRHVDESFKFAMDWDLLIRFREAGAKFAHLPDLFGLFRVHNAQKTLASIHNVGYAEMNRLRERTLGFVPSSKKINKKIAPFLLRHLVVDLLYRGKLRTRKNFDQLFILSRYFVGSSEKI